MMGVFKRLAVGSKAHDLTTNPPFYDAALLPRTLSGASFDRSSGLDSNVVMSPVMWVMRLFIMASAVVERRILPTKQNGEVKEGQKPTWEPVLDHDAELLLEQPNDFYDGDTLWQGSIVSFLLGGNAYWRKMRNRFGEVVELWYLPHWLVTPKWPSDGSRFIDYYEYRAGGGAPVERIPLRDIVHFRFGIDPRNTRLGLSPLQTLLREVFTDDEAALFSATILQNMGVPGLMISPTSEIMRPTPEDIAEVKRTANEKWNGSKRGGALVMGVPTKVEQFGFDPNKLMLANLRDISEERVCAAMGLPAAVVGFGSGLQSTKVGATMRELVKMSYVGCLSPMQTTYGKQCTRQLLPDFVGQLRRFRIRFDTSDVEGFQEDDNQKTDRIIKQVQGGVRRVDRAQAALGIEVDETQKVYLRPSNSMPIDEQGNPIQPAAPAGAVQGGGNGDGTNPTPAGTNRISGNGNNPPSEG